MAIRKICIVNVQVVKCNFAASKHYHLKLLTRKVIILNFELVKSSWKLIKKLFKFSAHKTRLSTGKLFSYISKSQNKFPTHKITSQLIKKLAFRKIFFLKPPLTNRNSQLATRKQENHVRNMSWH